MDGELHRLSPHQPASPATLGTALLNDCTLREGEQSSDASFSTADRADVARALAEAGVDRLQIGLRPADPAGNRAVIEAAGRAGTEVLIIGFQPDWRRQIDVALEAGASHVNVIFRVSPPLLGLLGTTAEQVLEDSVAALAYAREQGARTIYSAGDTMRAEWPSLEALYSAAVAAGAEAVYVLDTSGVAAPGAVAAMVRRVVDLVGDVPVGVHAHNDLGLALANALAAYEAGATLIDTCVNGMGDRCGNPSLDEVAVACALVYGRPTGVRLDALAPVARLVAERSGVPIPPSKPLVGTNAYSHKLDIHVRAMLADPLAFQPVRPELVGGRPRIVVGKNSGPLTLRARMDELGLLALPDDRVPVALALVDRYAEAHKASVPDDELARIVEEARGR